MRPAPWFAALLAMEWAPAQTTAPAALQVEFTVEAACGPGPIRMWVSSLSDRLPPGSESMGWSDGTPVSIDRRSHDGEADRIGFEIDWVATEPIPAGTHRRTLLPTPSNERTDDRPRFQFVEATDATTLILGDRARYRSEHHYDPEQHETTYKPFVHVHALHDDGFLTKGPGGEFSHHRGVFLGFNKTRVGDRTFDFWHCNDTSLRWTGAVTREVDAVRAIAVDRIDWCAADGNPIVVEQRTITAWNVADRTILDFESVLSAAGDQPVALGGDPQHAGLQFRAAQEVHDHKADTVYERPATAKGGADDVWTDTAWVTCRFEIRDVEYAVTHLTHPDNPAPWVYSTRDYGRFGSFAATELRAGAPVSIRCRLVVTKADDPLDGERALRDYANTMSGRLVTD